jgi:hypothetical protein
MNIRRHALASGLLLFGLGAFTSACASGGPTPIVDTETADDGGYDGGSATDNASQVQVVSDDGPTGEDAATVDASPTVDDVPTATDDSGSGGGSGSASGDSGSCNAPTCAACVSGNPCCTSAGACGCPLLGFCF